MTDEPKPTTINDAFDLWLKLEEELAAATDSADFDRLVLAALEVEKLAVTLPTVTVSDVWKLIRMTTDQENEVPHYTADMVVSRAYAECGH